MRGQGVVFGEEHLTRIETCLERVLLKSNGVAALFANAEGQPLGQMGSLSDKDKMALSTLAAGTFAATVAMAKLLGQAEAFHQLIFEGLEYCVCSSAVGQGYLLTIAFDTRAKPGLVRLLAQEATKELLGIVRQANEEAMELSVGEPIDAQFGESLAEALDSLFGDGAESFTLGSSDKEW